MRAGKVLWVALCLLFLSCNAYAVTLDFTGVTSLAGLAAYGASNGVTFNGFGIATDTDGTSLHRLSFADTTASMTFSNSVIFDSFDYILSSFPEGSSVSYNALLNTSSVSSGILSPTSSLLTKSLNLELSKIIFTLDVPVTGGVNLLNVDNVKFKAVPVPAAAFLLGAGLLGIVGIRRRQAV